jgi:hypothetical protein
MSFAAKNVQIDVALTDADQRDHQRRIAHERLHLLLLEDARRGLADIDAWRTEDADMAVARLQRSREAQSDKRRS